jgi:DNA-binding protein HU-beta
MMALAIHLRELVDNGQVCDYTALAELGHVSRARITQIMDLTLLAPDIQEALLFLPKIEKGRDRLNERMLRGIAAESVWARQREKMARVARLLRMGYISPKFMEVVMTKAELVKKLKEEAGLATLTQAEAAYANLFSAIAGALKNGDTVAISGFGSFKQVKRAARTGRNPRTGQEIKIPARKTVKFTPGKALKESL